MGAAMNSPMTCILPPELIPIVLSNLEKADLLNCRLVCKSWDTECLKISRASDWKLKLNRENIQNYVEFMQGSPTPQRVLPLQLAFEFYTATESLKEGIKSLLVILGENCFESFKLADDCWLSDDEDEDDEDGLEQDYAVDAGKKFMELLALVSKGLKALNLKKLYVELSVENVLSITTHLNISIGFPNLKSFISHKARPREAVKIPALFNYLMEDNPNLRTLSVDIPNTGDIHHWNIPLTTLQTLSIGNFKPTLPFLQKIQLYKPPLKEFDILDSEIQTDSEGMQLVCILTSISSTLECLKLTVGPNVSLTFPVLKKLKHLKWLKENIPVFQNINQINFNSVTFPSLETLEIGIDLEDEMKEPIFPTSRLPDFPNLKHVSIHSNAVTWEWDLKPFAAEKIYFDMRFLYSKQTTRFQTMTEVSLVCDSTVARGLEQPNQLSEKCMKENIEEFSVLFPALSKISLKYSPPYIFDDPEGCKSEYYFVRILKMFLQSIDEANIKEITILNSSRNFLGKALKEILNPPILILKNLEGHPRLIGPLAKAWRDYTSGLEEIGAESGDDNKTTVIRNLSGCDPGLNVKVFNGVERIRMMAKWMKPKKLECNLDFTLMARYFPNLRELAIPADWFSTDETRCSEQIQNIRQLFPGINIDRVPC